MIDLNTFYIEIWQHSPAELRCQLVYRIYPNRVLFDSSKGATAGVERELLGHWGVGARALTA